MRVYSVLKPKAVFTDGINKVPFMLHYVTIKVMEPKHKIKNFVIFLVSFACLWGFFILILSIERESVASLEL